MNYTRKQYLNNECTHREYYAQYVNGNTINTIKKYVDRDVMEMPFEKDRYGKRLKHKDFLVSCINYSGKTNNIFKESGETRTQSAMVCIVCEAYEQLKELELLQEA